MPWGLLVGVSRGWRRVLGIADQGLVWVAPCLRDCCGLGGAVSLGLVRRASCGWRRVFRLAHRGVGGAVAWGFASRARRVCAAASRARAW